MTTTQPNILANLDELQRQRLSVLMKEAEQRGLPVAESIRKLRQRNSKPWYTDENGYFTRSDGRQFKPYPDQEHFVLDDARFSLFLGSRGSGKSCGGAQKALRKLQQGYSGAVFNPHFENFKTSTWPEFRAWIPWNRVVWQQRYRSDPAWEPQRPFTLTFENGAQVHCKGLKDAASARGPNINWLWYDEAQDDEDGMGWRIALASVRVGKHPQAWCTATGRGTYHWMYEFFVEQRFDDETKEVFQQIQETIERDFELFSWYHGTIHDNKDNLDPMFHASMIASYPPGYLREQELEGKFADPGGNLGDVHWFDGKQLDEFPTKTIKRIRYWDLAASEKKISGASGKKLTDPDETVGTLLSHWIDSDTKDDRFCIEHQHAGRWEWKDIKIQIREIALNDGPFVEIWCEQEPGSGGKNQLAALFEYLRGELPGWTFHEHNPRDYGDKIMRSNVWFAEAGLGKFFILKGDWTQEFFRQLASFPSGKHDDRIDSVSGARLMIAPIRRWKKQKFMHLGQVFEMTNDNEENKV
jgi:predicted phage terminase large subunit-like protein